MQRKGQNPNKSVKKKPRPVKLQTKSKSILSNDDGDDRSSVCSNGSFSHRRAEVEEIRLKAELEVEIEMEIEQELIDAISELVRRLSDLKARQIARQQRKAPTLTDCSDAESTTGPLLSRNPG